MRDIHKDVWNKNLRKVRANCSDKLFFLINEKIYNPLDKIINHDIRTKFIIKISEQIGESKYG